MRMGKRGYSTRGKESPWKGTSCDATGRQGKGIDTRKARRGGKVKLERAGAERAGDSYPLNNLRSGEREDAL